VKDSGYKSLSENRTGMTMTMSNEEELELFERCSGSGPKGEEENRQGLKKMKSGNCYQTETWGDKKRKKTFMWKKVCREERPLCGMCRKGRYALTGRRHESITREEIWGEESPILERKGGRCRGRR